MAELVHGESEAEPKILRGLRLAFLLSIGTLAVEALGAYFSRSLSLTADAVHNIPDLIAFAASWGALASIRTGTTSAYTFGSHRAEVFAGLLNAVLVLLTGAGFGYAASAALLAHAPFAGPVDSLWLLSTAIPVLALRGTSVLSLRAVGGRAADLNLTGVIVHLGSDLVITGALLVDGALLYLSPSASWIDPGAAAVVGAVLVWESLPLFRAAWEVLTERIPRNLSVGAIITAAEEEPSVSEVHDVHVWAVCPTLVCMSAHVRVKEMSVRESMEVVARLRQTMEQRFGIVHSVFEVETATTG